MLITEIETGSKMGFGRRIVLVLKILALRWQWYSLQDLGANQLAVWEWSLKTLEVSAGFGSQIAFW